MLVTVPKAVNCTLLWLILASNAAVEKTRELCKRDKIVKVPHFNFYKNVEKIHEEEEYWPGSACNHSAVVQLHCREDVEKIIEEHKEDHDKLLVLDVRLKHYGPCVKVMVLKLYSFTC